MFVKCDVWQIVSTEFHCYGGAEIITADQLAQELYSYLNPSFANQFRCIGDLVPIDPNTLQCSTAWDLNTQVFDPATLDPQMIAGAVGVGFFVMTSLFVVVKGAHFLLKLVK